MKKFKISDKSPHYLGHRIRLREKFSSYGAGSFHDYELLELLLTYSIPRKDVKKEAKALISRFKSISGVLSADIKELCEIEGISANSAVLISLCRELAAKSLEDKIFNKDILSSPQSVYDFSKVKLSHLENEVFMVIYLNTKNHVQGHEIIDEGTVDTAIVYPRKIVKSVIGKKASSVILVHNHPSGICEPSNDDIRLTSAVKDSLKTVDVKVLDHIISGKSGYFSFREKNLI
ncbi:MAG: DNA repair protein RadC [Victivallales bacterium]|jgi:DNA repair protein RadC